ncbi:unnamed protein product [Polarella glacialis]|uniref:Uncharacterized protein n=1 Tax=Polarella glacialis TaxID=89957 RepID=A0A813FIN4_POLGL|nr:unnamed protein product [Polarella glacialis]
MADPAGSFLGLLKRPPPEEEEEAGGLGASECGDAGLGGHEAEAEAAGKLETKSESRSPIPPSRSSRAPPAGGGGGLWNEREEAATDAAPAGDELPGSDGGGDPWAWLAGTLWRDTGQPKEYRMLVHEGKILVVLTRRNFENVVEVRRLPSGDLGWGLQPGRGRAKFILSQKDCGNRDEIVWRHGGSSTVSHRWRFIPLELDPPQRSRSPAEREREEQLPRSEAPEGELREGEVWEEGEGVWEESEFLGDPFPPPEGGGRGRQREVDGVPGPGQQGILSFGAPPRAEEDQTNCAAEGRNEAPPTPGAGALVNGGQQRSPDLTTGSPSQVEFVPF